MTAAFNPPAPSAPHANSAAAVPRHDHLGLDSDAKTPVSGTARGKKGLLLLRKPAHCWERRRNERSEGPALYSYTYVCFCQSWAGRKFLLPKMPLSCLSQGYLSQHIIPTQRFLQPSESKMLAKKTSPAQYVWFQCHCHSSC